MAASVDDFADWVSPHLAAMSQLAARLAGSHGRDDVVQETLARAWRRWETYRPERGTPRVWLLAIVADRSRRSRQERSSGPLSAATAAAGVNEPDLDLEMAVRRLPRRQRLAVELHYFVDLSVADVAAVMGCSQGTVKSTLFDARARLRSQLGEP